MDAGKPSWRDQLVAELRLMARGFFRPFALTVLLVGGCYALVVAFGESDAAARDKALLVPVAFAYGAFVGVWPGLMVGGVRLCWWLVGRWMAVPLVLGPAVLALALWSSAGLLAGLAAEIGEAAVRAGAEREWLASSVGKAAHAGPLMVIVLLPLLIVDLGAIALDLQVLWAMIVLLVAFGLVITLALLPVAAVSIPVLLRAYLVRLRARIEARRTTCAPKASS